MDAEPHDGESPDIIHGGVRRAGGAPRRLRAAPSHSRSHADTPGQIGDVVLPDGRNMIEISSNVPQFVFAQTRRPAIGLADTPPHARLPRELADESSAQDTAHRADVDQTHLCS